MLTNLRETIGGLIAPSLITRRNEAERAAATDTLTGLGNREAFNRAVRNLPADQAVILFDCNNFGLVNKVFGHTEGDKVLMQFAETLAEVAFHYKARVFRFGGDEFAMLCPRAFASRVRDTAERRAPDLSFDNFRVSISGEIGESVEAADAKLQARKAARKMRK